MFMIYLNINTIYLDNHLYCPNCKIIERSFSNYFPNLTYSKSHHICTIVNLIKYSLFNYLYITHCLIYYTA